MSFSDNTKTAFIMNPWAGRGLKNIDELILSYSKSHGLDWRIEICSEKYSVKQTTLRAIESGCDCIVSVGGDGTLNEVTSVLINTDIAFGLIPSGSGNDFAKTIESNKKIEDVLKMIHAGKTKRIDMAVLNDRTFINNAGIGFDALVIRNFEKYKKMGFRGLPAYSLSTLQTLRETSYFPATVVLKGIKIFGDLGVGEHISNAISGDELHLNLQEYLLVSISNGRYIGGGMKIAPRAELDDGLFDVCVVNKISKRSIYKLLPKLLSGKHIEHPDLCAYIRAKSVEIAVDERYGEDVYAQFDGELTKSNSFSLSIMDSALSIII